MPAFGRIRSIADPRDHAYSLRSLLPPTPSARMFRYHSQNGWWGDQGEKPECVAYASVHWLEDGPILQKSAPAPIVNPDTLYHEAQALDDIPGEDYDGTTVRGAAKALQARGFISTYHWGTTLDDLVETVLEIGPVVMGTNWYTGMMEPNPNDFTLSLTGQVEGGHAYVLNGVTKRMRVFRLKNSWGREWGHKGNAWLHFDDVARLLREDGEAMLALEVPH